MTLKQILQQPVPDHTIARQQKIGYREHPIKLNNTRKDEPLVDIAEYGIAGQSYYSRQNYNAGQAIPGVPKAILLRQSIAERLADINYALQHSSAITELFGGNVELYVDEGYRDPALQERLYKKLVPELIKREHPKWSQKQILERRDEIIAAPPRGDASPSPHATGAAIDLKLRFMQADLGFNPNAQVDMRGGSMASQTSNPDYYEHITVKTASDKVLRQNRRIFYWVMRGALIDDDSGFVVNPTEFWHWSYGDQMWAQLTNAPEAFFTAAQQ